MTWIYITFLLISIAHMGEEYFYPGGFMDFMKRLNPRFEPLITMRMAVIVNGLQLLLCVTLIVMGRHTLVFGMSVAALLLVNGLVHIAGCFRVRGYAPGVFTGALLYLPFSLYAWRLGISSGQLTLKGMIGSAVLGLLYQAVPIGYLALASTIRRRRDDRTQVARRRGAEGGFGEG